MKINQSDKLFQHLLSSISESGHTLVRISVIVFFWLFGKDIDCLRVLQGAFEAYWFFLRLSEILSAIFPLSVIGKTKCRIALIADSDVYNVI